MSLQIQTSLTAFKGLAYLLGGVVASITLGIAGIFIIALIMACRWSETKTH